jgi:hypothetical protein
VDNLCGQSAVSAHDEQHRTVAASQEWGVRPVVPAVAGVLCLAFLIWLFIATAPEDRLVAGAGVCLSAIAAAVLVTMRHRLTAYSDAFVIRGPTGAREVSWDKVVGVSAPARRRRGLASTSVEIELDDDTLILFNRTELGADPTEVSMALRRWWKAGSA